MRSGGEGNEALTRKAGRREVWLQVFFGVAACSWVPHWSCHYYRIETVSGFTVGSWEFSTLDSWISLLMYGLLIGSNLVAIAWAPIRRAAALASGLLHIVIGGLHVYRLFAPFRFEVFGYPWSLQASLREALAVMGFGLLCLWVARDARRLQWS